MVSLAVCVGVCTKTGSCKAVAAGISPVHLQAPASALAAAQILKLIVAAGLQQLKSLYAAC